MLRDQFSIRFLGFREPCRKSDQSAFVQISPALEIIDNLLLLRVVFRSLGSPDFLSGPGLPLSTAFIFSIILFFVYFIFAILVLISVFMGMPSFIPSIFSIPSQHFMPPDFFTSGALTADASFPSLCSSCLCSDALLCPKAYAIANVRAKITITRTCFIADYAVETQCDV
jgi:hypothetical protein